MLVRSAAHSGPLGRMRVVLLKKLADALDPTKQTAAVRAKAIKAITTVVKSDTSVLGFPEIQHCVHRALKVYPGDSLCGAHTLALHLLHVNKIHERQSATFHAKEMI